MTETPRKSARPQLLLIALLFFGPLLVAAWMYYGGQFSPAGGSNHGSLIEPVVSLRDALPHSDLLAAGDGRWILLHASDGDCTAACQDALYTMRQGRLMLGKDQDRLLRALLHGDAAPDKVFLADEHKGLLTTQDAGLAGILKNKRPNGLSNGGFYLIDPLGNLVMYFEPELDPRDMIDDIRHLLKLSHIG